MDLMQTLKGLFGITDDEFLKNLKKTNRSVNFYKDDVALEKGIPYEQQYEMWKNNIRKLYKEDPETFNSIPSEYEYKNMNTPEFLTDPSGTINAITNPINREDLGSNSPWDQLAREGPSIQYRNTIGAMTPRTQKHESFHAADNASYPEDYWKDWSFLTSYYPGDGPKKVGQDITDSALKNFMGSSPEAYIARNTIGGWESGGLLGSGRNAMEEAAAAIYASGGPDMKKPEWMTKKQWNILTNLVRTRMNIWPDEVQ